MDEAVERIKDAYLKFSGQEALREIRIAVLKQENPNWTLEDLADISPSQEEVDKLYLQYLRIKEEYY